MVHPKKRLGQHFLTDPSIAERIVSSLEVVPEDAVVEIGPGKGILTQFLMKKDIRLIPVEIDRESVAYLLKKWPALEEEMLEADILKLNWSEELPESMHIIGNFPYNISSQIFFKVLENKDQVNRVVCMLQKEVALRLVSPPGSKAYGILSVLLQAFFDISYLFSVKPGSFFPPPKVQSGVIILERNKRAKLDCDEKLFFSVVKQTFNHRRKTIRNSLKTKLLNLDTDSILLTKRPEQLTVSEFVELTKLVQPA